MNIYIDLGAHDGKVLKRVIKAFNGVDLFVAFEPIPKFYNKLIKRFKNNHRVKIFPVAAACCDEDEIKFYIQRQRYDNKKIAQGSTLLGIYDHFEMVQAVNFSKYLERNFKISDNIVVKIDIEGYEYDLLEHLIETGNIKYINKIYCEWHPAKLRKKIKNKHSVLNRHKNLVLKLQELGFDLKGDNDFDELSRKSKRLLKMEQFY